MDLNYDPRCSIYLNGKYYYLSYYLPNGKRILKSLSTSKRMLAKKKMHLKEQELYEGIFDDHDILKMPEIRVSPQVRLDLNLGVEKYLDASGVHKNARTQNNDKYALESLISRLDKVFVDEVTPYDIQMLLGKLKSENKKEATLRTYRGILKKFFAWITENGLVQMDNPVNKHSLIKQTSNLVRDRLPKPEEIQRILSCDSEIMPVMRFLIHTGARLGEVLHLEWEDIEDGFWHIRYKPNCPTKFGIGWSPKWGKSRSIPLKPEALEVFENLPRVSRWVFPKADGTRRDSLDKSWKTLLKKAQVEDLQIKDFRNWANHILKHENLFTTKEASSYLGHSPMVNESHYEPISKERIYQKINMEGYNCYKTATKSNSGVYREILRN